ncbi:MAG TPA: hypothetical protein VN831_08605 [Bradyrhizobium sp.]|nr:hypothetical protein [Bradyrhizobium sp.]
MSSWEKWKKRLIWLVSMPQLAWSKAATFAKQRPVLATIAGVVAVLIFGGLYYEKRPLFDFFNHADKDGKIIVNSPTVYTRQRLVNDRLDQAHWLRSQLELTDSGLSDKFQSIDQIRRVLSNSQINLGASPTATPTEKAAADELAVETTTLALFRAKNTYREEVRSEITQTELDDRHDIKGNTIFRLTFDASVIAGTRRDAVAAVVIKLSHRPENAISAKTAPYYDDYQILYDEWVRYFQETIPISLANIQDSISSREPHPRLRTLFTEFLSRRICQFVQNDPDLTKDPLPCKPDQLKAATKLISDYEDARLEKLGKYKDKVFDFTLKSYKAAGYVFPASPDAATLFDSLRYNARVKCARDNKTEIALWEMGIRLPQTKQDAKKYQASEQIAGDRIGCPYYDNLQAHMVSGAQLYEDLFSISSQNKLAVASGDFNGYAKGTIQGLDVCEKDGCEVRSSRLRCFSADFIKANLNAFIDQNAEAKQRINHFLKFQIVGRELNDCNILVTGLPEVNKDPDGKSYLLLKEFGASLNRGTDAFAYSVTPKNLTENISTATDTRDALLFRATGKDKDIANLLRSRSEQSREIVAHPIIVGYGSPRIAVSENQERTAGIRDIDFGWIIAPRTRENGVFEQIDGQYPLTVFVSVPGWWRTVEMHVKTCWISRTANYESGQSIKNMCSGPDGETGTIAIRLPSSSPEISRKLGFDDAVQQPSLNTRLQQELVVGQHGSLLLEGQRLWRSTEVTAGAQRADRITVLPNMGGILAEFKCVLPPAGLRVERRNFNVTRDDHQIVTKDSIRVWTSEGVTETLLVDLLWLDGWEDRLAKCQNPPSTQTATQGTAKPVAQITPRKPTPNAMQPPAGTVTTASEAATVQPLAKPPPAP